MRFVPLLRREDYERLKTAREQAAVRFSKGAAGKDEYTQWQRQYEECQVPTFFTKDYSIFVDRWADRGAIVGHRIEPRFIEVYPPEAALDVEAVIGSLRRLFNEYENAGTTKN